MTKKEEKLKYKVVYGSNSQRQNVIISTSRDAKKHGGCLLGTQGGGYVNIYLGDKQISAARYTPNSGGKWYSVVF